MFKIDSHIKPPRAKKVKAMPDNVRNAYNEYAEAYKKAYGVSPTGVTYNKQTNYIYVGNSAGVTLSRLKELTRQLKWRVGA